MELPNDIFESWSFLINASDADIRDVRQSVSACTGHNLPDNTSRKELVTYFCKFIRKQEVVEYRKFLSNVFDAAYPEVNHSFKNIEVPVEKIEDDLMSRFLQDIVKACPDKDLADIKKALKLTNNEKSSMLREIVAKTQSSRSFVTLLPAVLSSITLGRMAMLTIPSILGLGLSILSGPIGIIASTVATMAISGSKARTKDQAKSICPAVFVLIKIRRDGMAKIYTSDDAIKYIDFLLKSNSSYPSITEAAIEARKDFERNGGSDGKFLTQRDIQLLAPFEWDVMKYLNSYAHDNSRESDLSFQVKKAKHSPSIGSTEVTSQKSIAYGNELGGMFPSTEDAFDHVDKAEASLMYSAKTENLKAKEREILYLNHRIKELQMQLDRAYQSRNESFDVVEKLRSDNVELKDKVDFMNEILHGIRHNLSVAFADTLRPYNQYCEFKDQPFPISKVDSALTKGNIIIEVLKNAGLSKYGAPEEIDLAKAIRENFLEANFCLTEDSILPEKALIDFNGADLHTFVLNNIRTNIESHAFGVWSKDEFPKSKRLVRVTLSESDHDWNLTIENNGEPFPSNVNPETVFEFGKSFDENLSVTGIHGTGLFYLSRAVLHFGGQRAFIPQPGNAFPVKYLITFKKHQ